MFSNLRYCYDSYRVEGETFGYHVSRLHFLWVYFFTRTYTRDQRTTDKFNFGVWHRPTK